MNNRYGDADAEFPMDSLGFQPGYLHYIDALGRRPENPTSLILAAGEQAVVHIVRACGSVLGPVYHLSDSDHAAMRAAVARLEAGGPLLAVTGDRIFLTCAGAHRGCPFCGAFGPGDTGGWSPGACPVMAVTAESNTELLTGTVLAALHVLLDELCATADEALARLAQGYSIQLTARLRSGKGLADLAGVRRHRAHA